MTVVLTRHDNVVGVDFRSAAPPPAAEREDPWWPWAEPSGDASGKPSTATRLPARWSPRPIHVLADRFTRSQLYADLRGWAGFVVFLTGVLAGLVLADQLRALVHTLTGGTP